MQSIVHELVLVFSYQPHFLLLLSMLSYEIPRENYRCLTFSALKFWNIRMSPYLSLPIQLIHMVLFMYSFCVLADHEVGRTYSSFIWSLNWASSFFFFQPSPHSPCYYFQEILAAFPYLIISSLISKMLCIQWIMLILELVLTVSVPVNGPSRQQQQWP